MKLAGQRPSQRLVLLCSVAYFCSYLTRINYAAVMVEIIAREGISRIEASAALTGLFVCYSLGQLVSGYLGDRLAPQKLVFTGLLVCSLMNLLLPLFSAPWARTVIWSVNGFAQAMMWPPLVRIISGRFSGDEYKKAIMWVISGGTVSTIFVYLSAPLIISLAGWRVVFYLSASAAFTMAFLWRRGFEKIGVRLESAQAVPGPRAVPGRRPIPGDLWGMVGLILAAIMLQGMLRDGISSWMPSYLNDSFMTGSAASILSSVAIPVTAIAANYFVLYINRRFVRNEMLCAGLVFSAGLVSLIVLRLFGAGNFMVSVMALTVSAASMNGVSLVLTSMLPKYFERFGFISFVTGLLNFFVYVGSAVSIFGIAALTERYDWPATVMVWCLIALIGTAFCLVSARRWGWFKDANSTL